MKSNLMRAAAAALIAALAAGAVLPGEAAAKPPGGKAPDSKPLPKWYFKKKLYLSCQVIQTGQQRKVRVVNPLGYALSAGTKFYWRAKGSRGSDGGYYTFPLPFHPGGHIEFNVSSTIMGCRAWFMASAYR